MKRFGWGVANPVQQKEFIEMMNHFITSWKTSWKNRINMLWKTSKQLIDSKMKNWKTKVAILWKTFKWFFFTLIVGLSPVLIAFVFSYIIPPKITLQKVIMDGALLFFSVTIVSSLLIDYCLSEEKIPDKKPLRILFFGMPALIVFICIILFALTYERNTQPIEFDILIGVQLAILTASFVYTTFIKFGIFNVHQQMFDRLSVLKNLKLLRILHLFDKGNHK